MAGLSYKNGATYWGKVTSNHLGKTKTNKPQLILQFTIVGEVNPMEPDGDLLPCEQNDRTVFLVFTKDTEAWVSEKLELLGYSGDRPSLLEMDHPEGFDFSGKELAFYCKHETYDGRTREKWDISTGKKSLEIVKLDPKELRELDNLFGRNLKPKPKQTKPEQVEKQRQELMQNEGKKFDEEMNKELASVDEKDAIPF